MNQNKKQTSIYLNDNIRKDINNICKFKGKKFNDIITDALEEYVKTFKDKEIERIKKEIEKLNIGNYLQ